MALDEKNVGLLILKILKEVKKGTADFIIKSLKDIPQSTVEKSLTELLEYQLVEKSEEEGTIYYALPSILDSEITRSIKPEYRSAVDIAVNEIDLVANMPPPVIQREIIPEEELPVQAPIVQEAMFTESAFEAIPHSTDFEINLEHALSSDVPWKKELIEMAKALHIQNDHTKAIELLKQAIQIAKKEGLPPQLIELYRKLAIELRIIGKGEEVKELYLEALDVTKERGYPKGQIEFHINLGQISYANKDYEETLKEFQVALKLAKENDLKEEIHEIFTKIANVYKDLNQFETALEYYLQDYSLAQDAFLKDLPSLNNKIGGILIKLGRNEEAITYFDKAYALYEKKGDKQNQIISLMNKNVSLYNLKRWDDLVELYIKVIDLLEDEEQKEGLWQQIGSFIHLSSKKDIKKTYKKKIDTLKKSGEPKQMASEMRIMTKRAVAASQVSASKFSKALWNYNIAVAEFAEGRFKEAEILYKKAEVYYQELEDFKGLGQCNHHLGVIEIQKNKLSEAITRLQKAAEFYENVKKEVTVEEFRTTLQSDVIPVLEDLAYAYLLHKEPLQSLDTLERGKSREIVRKMEGFDPTSSCPELAELIKNERTLLEKFGDKEYELANRKNAYVTGEINYEEYMEYTKPLKDEIRELSAKLRQTRLEIFEKCADPGHILPSMDYSIVNEALKTLRDKNVLVVEFFYYSRRSLIIVNVLESNGKISQYSKPVNNTWLRKALEELQMGIDTLSNSILTQLGPRLYELLIPEEFGKKYLKNSTDSPLIIIPHHELYAIPWEILKKPDSDSEWGGYLGLEYQISRSFSLDLARIMLNKGTNETGKEFLLFGNPTGDLPGAQNEVKLLDEEFKNENPATLFLGTAVSRENFKKNISLEKFGVIHYAGHADFIEAEPSLSLLKLADGSLTARELGMIKTQSPLFFISACESGQAKGSGGGEVFGMIRGLTLSGAQTVISTNWSVSDDSAMDLAINFYKNLRKEMSATAALLEARRFNSKKYRNVLVWASTTLYGNPLFKL